MSRTNFTETEALLLAIEATDVADSWAEREEALSTYLRENFLIGELIRLRAAVCLLHSSIEEVLR